MAVASGPDTVGTCGYCQTARVRPATHEGIRKEPVFDASLARTALKPGGYGVGLRCEPGCFDKQAPVRCGNRPWRVGRRVCLRARRRPPGYSRVPPVRTGTK